MVPPLWLSGLVKSPVARGTMLTSAVGITATQMGLVAAWPLNEASGNAIDSFGSNTLSDINTVTSAAGKVGTARQFTAPNTEHLRSADSVSLSTGNIDFWISAWGLFDTLPGAGCCVVGKWGGAGSNELAIDWDGTSRFRFYISADGTAATIVVANTFGAPSTATWYHFFCYHDSVADVIKISINGGAFDSAAATSGVFDSAAFFNIGLRGTDEYMNGRIDAVHFGKSPPTGITAMAVPIRDFLYNAGAGREYPF